MALYRANPKDGVAWVTGASSGIGRAVALDLARDGYAVAVTARGKEELSALVDEAAHLGHRIIAFPADVTDAKAMAEAVEAIEAQAGPIVLALFNAGTYFPTRGDRMEIANFVKTFEVNVFGVLNGMAPMVRRMRERGRGHIAIVASVSSYFGWPATGAYGGSKAALNNIAESLKFDLDRMNIRIKVMNPGFINTPLTQKSAFPMPALMEVEEAARRMVAGLKWGGFETTFPHRFTWFLKVLRFLPQPVRFWFVKKATRWDKRPLSTGRKPDKTVAKP